MYNVLEHFNITAWENLWILLMRYEPLCFFHVFGYYVTRLNDISNQQLLDTDSFPASHICEFKT